MGQTGDALRSGKDSRGERRGDVFAGSRERGRRECLSSGWTHPMLRARLSRFASAPLHSDQVSRPRWAGRA